MPREKPYLEFGKTLRTVRGKYASDRVEFEELVSHYKPHDMSPITYNDLEKWENGVSLPDSVRFEKLIGYFRQQAGKQGKTHSAKKMSQEIDGLQTAYDLGVFIKQNIDEIKSDTRKKPDTSKGR